ncbi:UNVERIFIED_ORG: uncharacterized protein YjbJ (UPF0337 family) [Nocardia globerula]|jgi:uncharacterized protein YjbJ (UPF0337 family)|uniref:Uncharacterized protein YjbJ (UPF0337 family) n=2 Tax=Nocardiaceae TaxID=85025 RepID=A0A652YM10_NOCGL|nr:CsbD-like protein [Rhodococcus sp. AD45]PVX63852.1 uncharacterized protein YjbJ (UPF0337 family) [Rhodococcus globerulus]
MIIVFMYVPAEAPGETRSTDDHREEGTAMSIVKRIRHKAETAEGVIKKTVGKSLGNEKMEAEGRSEQAKGQAKQTGDKLKQAGRKFRDAFKH